jgi:hypothetical protein
MIFRFWLAILTALVLKTAVSHPLAPSTYQLLALHPGGQAQTTTTTTSGATSGVTTEVIIISIISNVTVTRVDTVTTTQTVQGQTQQSTGKLPGFTNSTRTAGGTGSGGLRPTGNGTFVPVRGQAAPADRQPGCLVPLVLLVTGMMLLA